jgi:hypothetical protein
LKDKQTQIFADRWPAQAAAEKSPTHAQPNFIYVHKQSSSKLLSIYATLCQYRVSAVSRLRYKSRCVYPPPPHIPPTLVENLFTLPTGLQNVAALFLLTFVFISRTLQIDWAYAIYSDYLLGMPIPGSARSKAWVCGRLLTGVVRSNPAATGKSVSSECSVFSYRVLCVGLITRSEKTYRLWCVCI